MDEDLISRATAPTTRALVTDLADRLGSADPAAMSENALAGGRLRAAVNLALAGALAGKHPPAALAARLTSCIESGDVLLLLLGSVESGLAEALANEAAGALHTPDRLALLLFLAASNLDGAPPPLELLRRIRLVAHSELPPKAKVLVGLAALELKDEDVLEVARPCVELADTRRGRRLARDLKKHLRQPLRDALPEKAPPDHFGGFTIRKATSRPGRNEPCHCGSGKKYKKCCLPGDGDDGPRADPGETWGDRVRFHRSMSDAQFKNLHPLELARIRPEDLATPRLVHAADYLAKHRLFAKAEACIVELAKRNDLPEGCTLEDLRIAFLRGAIGARDAEWVERIVASPHCPEALPEEFRISKEILGNSPEVLDRIEAMADRALREPSEEALGRLTGMLLYHTPALGILVARGTIDPATPLDIEETLELVEEARDMLLLPPHDAAWEIFDLLSERHLEARLEAASVEANEEVQAEAEELRRTVAAARARERSVRRDLERRERDLDEALRAAARHREEADRAQDTKGPSPEDLERLRGKVEEYKSRIAEGNHERRELRRELSRLGARMDEMANEYPAKDRDEEEAEEDPSIEDDYAPTRLTPRIPLFTHEFREGLRAVANHVVRTALTTAGALAATDPTAWSSVKSIRQVDGLLSCRIGRHRILFRLTGDDELELTRLIHRRDLESTLKRMA